MIPPRFDVLPHGLADEVVERRSASAFANIAFLDRPVADWPAFVVMNAVVDLATTRVLQTLRAPRSVRSG